MQKNNLKKKQLLVIPVKVREIVVSKVQNSFEDRDYIVYSKSRSWEAIPMYLPDKFGITKEPVPGDVLTVYKSYNNTLLGWDINGEVQHRVFNFEFKKINIYK